MDLTNLAFASLIAALLITGAGLYFTDIQSHYPNAAAHDPELVNMTANLTQSVYDLNESVGNATGTASTFTSSDNALAIAFGYMLGAFLAVIALIGGIPSVFNSTFNILGRTMGVFLPDALLMFVSVAVALVAVIGILYYLTKVK